jgi:hypothetical protein
MLMPIWKSLLFDECMGEPCAKNGRPTDNSDCFGCLKRPDPVWLDPWGMYAQLQVDVASLAASLQAERWIRLLEKIDDDAQSDQRHFFSSIANARGTEVDSSIDTNLRMLILSAQFCLNSSVQSPVVNKHVVYSASKLVSQSRCPELESLSRICIFRSGIPLSSPGPLNPRLPGISMTQQSHNPPALNPHIRLDFCIFGQVGTYQLVLVEGSNKRNPEMELVGTTDGNYKVGKQKTSSL